MLGPQLNKHTDIRQHKPLQVHFPFPRTLQWILAAETAVTLAAETAEALATETVGMKMRAGWLARALR